MPIKNLVGCCIFWPAFGRCALQTVRGPKCGLILTDYCFTKLRQQHTLNEKQFYLMTKMELNNAFFQLFSTKTLKMKILTSIWRVQHLNAGQNIQQLVNRNRLTMASLDLSAAFNIVNVKLLIKRLAILGLPMDVINQIEIGRYSYVLVGDIKSKVMTYM